MKSQDRQVVVQLSPAPPVKVPRKIFNLYDPGVQRWIQKRIERGEAVLVDGEEP